jgi:hypothetical protein
MTINDGTYKMSSYNDEMYIEKAIADDLITSLTDINDYTEGHLKGIDAIRNHYDVRWIKPIRISDKVASNLLATISTRLHAHHYDGMTIDSIIKESTPILSERIHLLREILNINGVLSSDKTHSLPYYNSCDDKVIERHVFIPMFNLIKMLKVKPRTRQSIANYFSEDVIEKYTLDLIIQMLIEKKAI